MSSAGQLAGCEAFQEVPASVAIQSQWFAIRTRSRHEKVVVERLGMQGIETFLPLVTRIHRWSDRRKQVQLPLFPGYAFVRLVPSPQDHSRVLRTFGVVNFVGARWTDSAIPEEQIRDIRLLLAQNIPLCDHSFLKLGQRVRIRGGALDGVEGILSAHNEDRSLIITVEAVQRSIAIRIEGYDVEVLR